jgi:hypothetical protein
VWELTLQVVAHHQWSQCFHLVTLDKYMKMALLPLFVLLFCSDLLIVVPETLSLSFILPSFADTFLHESLVDRIHSFIQVQCTHRQLGLSIH